MRPFGSVRQRGRMYEASYWHNRQRHVAPTTFAAKGDARAFLSAVEADIRRGAWIDPSAGRLLVWELAEEWLESNPTKRESTSAREELTVRLHILPTLGEHRLERVGPPDIQRLVNAWSADQAPRTVKRNYEVVRAMFGYAVRNDWLARNPCRNVHLPSIESTRRFDLTPENVAGIAAQVAIEYRPMIWLGAVLGLRWSEVAALRVGRIDLSAGRLAVAEALVRGTGGRNVFGPPKSKAGRRTMFMPETDVVELYEFFRSHGLEVVVDGGWGVDALLGYQSRPHSDLDIALPHEQVPLLRKLLADRGYVPLIDPTQPNGTSSSGTLRGRQVDVHSFTFEPPLDLTEVDSSSVPDDKPVSGVDYLRRSLYGFGMIAGTVVRCVPPEYMVLFHTGYPIDEDDFRDTSALCAKFGIALPAEYEPFVQRGLEERG